MWRDIGTWPNGSLTCSVKTADKGPVTARSSSPRLPHGDATDHCHWRVVTQASDKSLSKRGNVSHHVDRGASRPLIVVLPLVR
jgi:hypothetical protein